MRIVIFFVLQMIISKHNSTLLVDKNEDEKYGI